MILLSIVIPAYNSQGTIARLLDSIYRSKRTDFSKIEVIVIDDHSRDGTVGETALFLEKHKRDHFQFRIIELHKNAGPAAARNTGAKYARGKILLFLDADVELYPGSLAEVVRNFAEDEDIFALTGVWSKSQRSRNFFPKFKALRDWSYWINERDPKNYYYLFSTRVAAINRDLFLRLGGFDTTYKSALVEDIELTYRIARRYAIVFNPKVMVRHEFEDFLPIAKKYFWRSYFWSRIYRNRKKFDPVATTMKEALTTVSAAAIVFSLILALILSALSLPVALTYVVLAVLCLVFLVHLWGVRKFLTFARREEGMVFAVKAFFTGLILYLVILSGACYSLVKK
ncbi:MAG: family 2 glycosyl transferase [Candidatus Gottesmanbacteria bacterium GW2011_GWA2_43_14]|uniref:Family 2 glycosyl transferase n=1 Tax=Candidatus Gottesmanbacteria bacterium GW2011_GWA2_43_14 TaxID=1618443 RepID=A0A0G1FS17_9BACT|nr:MAG: family 2 glycosyl transferase [Candidatus Gottesmanbacteria bacterium GW2011_GWA2_43_14]